MGTIAKKLKHRLGRARARRQPTSLSKLRRLVRHVEDEIGPAKSPHGLRGYHPNHAVYLATQNMVSYLAEEMSALPELHEYAKIVGQAEDEYMPSGPPFSPLSTSYFTTWGDGSLVCDADQRYLWRWQAHSGIEIGGAKVIQVDPGPLHGAGPLVRTTGFDIKVLHQRNAGKE